MLTRLRVRALGRRARILPAITLLGLFVLFGLAGCATLTLNTAGSVTNCDNGITAPVSIKRDFRGSTVVIAQVSIEGHGPYAFAVDTGASVSIVDSAIADKIGLTQDGPGEPISGVGGSQQSIPVQVGEWDVGQIRLPAGRIVKLELPDAQKVNGIVGLLGSDILSQFGVVQIDYSTQTLVVFRQVVPEPTPGPGTPTRSPTPGAARPHPVV